MRSRRIIAAALAAGVVGAGVVVTPAVLAADEDPAPPSDRGPMLDRGQWRHDGPGQMNGRGRGMGHRQGYGMGRGAGPDAGQGRYADGQCPRLLADASTGTLTEAQEQMLAAQAEHEKMAHDLYAELADSTGDHRFRRIADAEGKHLQAIRTLLDRYGIDDPTDGYAAGEFASETVAKKYAAYLAEGSESPEAALGVGRTHEAEDVAALRKAADDVDAPDVKRVLEHLAHSSEMHLSAFSR
ncbi:MAG TPA: DUF2202 domain-containing protein [Nocardioidaceae bacterium]|nr:DUF2202 domain-containing protein [Nocardioidaceae bacterium]